MYTIKLVVGICILLLILGCGNNSSNVDIPKQDPVVKTTEQLPAKSIVLPPASTPPTDTPTEMVSPNPPVIMAPEPSVTIETTTQPILEPTMLQVPAMVVQPNEEIRPIEATSDHKLVLVYKTNNLLEEQDKQAIIATVQEKWLAGKTYEEIPFPEYSSKKYVGRKVMFVQAFRQMGEYDFTIRTYQILPDFSEERIEGAKGYIEHRKDLSDLIHEIKLLK